jgi:hypothetical protein
LKGDNFRKEKNSEITVKFFFKFQNKTRQNETFSAVGNKKSKNLKMGAYLSKEWSEVVTSASPGSPTETTNSGGDENGSDISNSSENGENLPARVGAGFVARRRILDADPRSISGVYQ